MKKKLGALKKAIKSIFKPIVITKMYRNRLPILDAPAPSNVRSLVNDTNNPPVVAVTTIQKKAESKLNSRNRGAFSDIHGAILSPMIWLTAVIPKATASMLMRSFRLGIRFILF